MIRRLRFPLLALLTTLVVMLFFGDFLTGRQHLEFQDPYSRMTRVIEKKYGLSSRDELVPNTMSDYYFNQLKQKRGDFNWQAAPDSFTIQAVTGRRIREADAIAPVIDLNANSEVYFLCALPTDKVRLAVIRSLFHERTQGTDAAAQSRNRRLVAQEKMRMETALAWAEVESKNPAISPARWWHEHAYIFGITPDGDPLSAPAAASLVK